MLIASSLDNPASALSTPNMSVMIAFHIRLQLNVLTLRHHAMGHGSREGLELLIEQPKKMEIPSSSDNTFF
jgi:hypothetical protein